MRNVGPCEYSRPCLFQGDTNSDSTRKVTICSQAGKKIILVGSTSKCRDSRKTKTLCKKVAISNKWSQYFRIVKGCQIPFLSQLLQEQLPREIHLYLKEKSIVAEEIENLLKKVATEKVHMKKVSAKSQFVSNFFLVKKEDGGNRPVINLKNCRRACNHWGISSSRAT